ncbi:RNA polymerase sigma factor [Devosia sp.]|uniref:RNA polymerase sigma factor n=1 Tax=Devosia sp. TaxID=1871048 RepID=UPI003A909A83
MKSPRRREAELAERYFPHAHGRLVALLARRFRTTELAPIEDAVQTAMLRALETWPRTGAPDAPDAWLYRVAFNLILEQRRTEARRRNIAASHPELAGDDSLPADLEAPDAAMVRMLLICCHDRLPRRSQLILALKLMCGLGVPEIARRLFETEAAVYKTLQRARRALRADTPALLELPLARLAGRLPRLCEVLYALFCEGFNALGGERAIRAELCAEAVRLAEVAAATPIGRDPQLAALLALMHFGLVRLPGRTGPDGELLLLAEQDRAVWNRDHIAVGLGWLAQSAAGDKFSRYHAEAGIAAEHCRAPSWAETDWARIVACHDLLHAHGTTPLQQLDRAVAIAELRGPEAGLAALAGISAPSRVEQSYLWLAVTAELNARLDRAAEAERLRQAAIAAAPTPWMQQLIARRA